MEVVAAAHSNGGVPPFHDHDVREWSRIDSLTGVLEKARLETNHWTANTNNSCHKYGKVVDSRARTDAGGALQQQARRQLEVFQSQIPGGHLQVIKTQTVSSSRWTNKSSDFENLQLTLNPLDLTSQKSKVNVGRSVSRRPPSRPRREDQEDTVKGFFNETSRKSTSSEDLTLDDKSSKSTEDLEDLEQLQSWRRSSKLRRSLQYNKPNKPNDLPENTGSVRKITEELEKGRRLNTALRGNNFDLEALDQILRSISSSTISDDLEEPKRNSFVTVETLQKVKDRLKHIQRGEQPLDRIPNYKEEEMDDGIFMNENLRSYIYGMENQKTGSLESKSKALNGRNEDWYNRRKSYGFEQVHQTSPINGKLESSTDSGICRSSEITILPKNDSTFKSSNYNPDLKSTTITIPIQSLDEIKRHSIAVDETKYDHNRKLKKVEFCKTEVHFTAESGRVNIVETDDKPPPTNNFRRRRRNSGSIIPDNNGLPVLHFGDSSYEKSLLGLPNDEESSSSTVTVNTSSYNVEEEKKEMFENVRGILKNKPIKPKPYHLGEIGFTDKWGVKLKPVPKKDPPYWKSTVTLQNTIYGQEEQNVPEFQKLLRNLRPTNKPDLLNNENGSNVWSVESDDNQWMENKVYSTKVNFGDGGTTIVENSHFEDKQQGVTWTRKENSVKGVSVERMKFQTQEPEVKPKTALMNEELSSPFLVGRNNSKESEYANVTDEKLHQKHSTNEIVLRQPKKSEMTYFGVSVSPKPARKRTETVINKNKPDLLQQLERNKKSDPIYENLKSDSNILEELTKAADEILQAVNDLAESRSPKPVKKEILETIVESKSWEKKKVSKTSFKRTSSTSSVESVEKKPPPRKVLKEPSLKKKTTNARRLQRVSSREALLQSRGSSSEDLGVEVPRKPRQIKKTRAVQLTITNGLEMKKSPTPKPPRRKREESRSKSKEELQTAPLKEIRHKTAVSTIRSTSERPSRDRSKKKEVSASRADLKKPIPSETVNHRISTARIKKCGGAETAGRL